MLVRKLGLVTVAVVAGILVSACRPSNYASEAVETDKPIQTAAGIYQTLTIDAFADILANRPNDFSIVNVHIPYAGEIEGTNANIPYNDIDALTAALPDKNAPIILYCRSGSMSQQATNALLELGYTQVWDVPGGMNAWRESGRELINVD